MDSTTLKATVIELRNRGMSFQDISKYLDSNYGVSKSRQALNGLYNRAKKSSAETEERQKLICDIVNLYCILGTAVEVTNKANILGISVTYNQVINIIRSKESYIADVRAAIVKSIVDKIGNTYDIREFKKTIAYKGVQINNKTFDAYLEEAYTIFIKQKIEGHLSLIYRLTSDKSMAKRIGKAFNMDITTNNLKERD